MSALQRRGPSSTAAALAVLLAACLAFGVLAGVDPALAIGGVVGVAFIVLVFSDLVAGITIYAALSFLEVLTASGAGTSFAKIVGVLLFGSWLLSRTVARRESVRDLLSTHTALIIWMTAFVAWNLISVLWATDIGIATTTVYRYVLQMLVVPIVYSAVRSRQDLLKIVCGYLLGAAISVAYGYVIGRPNTTNARLDTSRLVGSLGEANQAATVLVAAMALAVGMTLISRGYSRTRVIVVVAAVLSPIGLVQTLSRAGLIACAVVFICAVVFGGRWRPLAARWTAVVGLGIIGYFLLVAPPAALKRVTTSNSSGRNAIWMVGWRMFTSHPVTGVGAGNFEFVSARYLQRPGFVQNAGDFLIAPKIAHNIYLEQLSTLGVFGLISLLGVLICGIRASLRAAHIFERLGDPAMELLARFSMLALIAFLAADFFASELLSKQLWLVFALGPALYKLALLQRQTVSA